jgi:tetratricopeptide (TPR) repeat protein
LDHVQLTSNDKLKFHILNNLGNSYQSLALFKKASSSYFEALSVLKYEEDTLYKSGKKAEICINLGLVYFKQNLFKNALAIFHEARGVLENQSIEPQLATVYYNLGLAYAETDDYNAALNYLKLAKELNQILNNRLGLALCQRTFGRISSAKKLYVAAIEDQLGAINQLESLEAYAFLPYSYLGLGETYLAAESPKQAELALLKGLQISLKSGQRIEELQIYEGLIELYKSQGELELALMYYDIYSALSQELNDQQIGRLIGQLELKDLLEKRDLAARTPGLFHP